MRENAQLESEFLAKLKGKQGAEITEVSEPFQEDKTVLVCTICSAVILFCIKYRKYDPLFVPLPLCKTVPALQDFRLKERMTVPQQKNTATTRITDPPSPYKYNRLVQIRDLCIFIYCDKIYEDEEKNRKMKEERN